MKLIYTEQHRLRDAKTELYGGQLVAPFESPDRMDRILTAWHQRFDEPPVEPRAFSREHLLRVHDAKYVEFLETCWTRWQAEGFTGEAIATCWPSRRLPRLEIPEDIDGQLGYYCLAAETSICDGTWEAAVAAANVALTAQEHVAQFGTPAFALCRPPGHHAAVDMFGGYCFLNNAALAAQAWLDQGAQRIAVLDVDFHHGNGTQQIFYDRADVLFVSIHGDPKHAFPHFLGGADEAGSGPGEGYNVNFPLPPETAFEPWGAALDAGLARILDYAPDALVVSLGVDIYREDPISFFRLESDDFLRIGERIKTIGRPTLFMMEGGYAIDAIGVNTCNVIEGFENA